MDLMDGKQTKRTLWIIQEAEALIEFFAKLPAQAKVNF